MGLEHVGWCARRCIGNEPFAVLLGDDIIHIDIPCLGQMMDVFKETYSSLLAKHNREQVSLYGIVDGTPID